MSRTSREASGNGAGEARYPLFAVDEGWVEKHLPNVNASINQLIDEFCKNPSLPRVEHSLHCELYGHLVASGELGETQDYGLVRPRRVQKEWPETASRQTQDGTFRKRGNFDLVVLGPPEDGTPPSLDPENFRLGLIKPGVVIEIGLDYGLAHLKADFEKMTNSGVRHGYLIHLSRLPHHGETVNHVESWITTHLGKEDEGIQLAYAQVIEDGRAVRYRKLGEPTINSIRISNTPL